MNRISKLLMACIAIYPALFVFQGLDFTDQGYWVTAYANVFTHPESVSYTFNCWLSDVAGGLSLSALGFLGLASLRVGYLLVLYLTIYGAYRTVRLVCDAPPEIVLASLLVAVTFATWDIQGSMVWIGYNDLTALFFVWAVWFIVRWSGAPSQRRDLLAAGILLGINCFVRIPNVAGVALGASLIFFARVTGRSHWDMIRDVLWLIAGVLAGAGACLLVILALGHLHFFIKGVQDVVGAKQDKETHGFGKMVLGPIRDNLEALGIAAYVLGLFAVLWRLGRAIAARLQGTATIVALAVLTGAGLAMFPIPVVSRIAHRIIRVRLIWSYAGVFYVLLAAAAFLPVPGFIGHPRRRLGAFASLLVMLLLPLGSERSLMNSHYAMWLPIAALGTYMYSIARGDRAWLFTKLAASVAVVVTGVVGVWRTPYRDLHDRRELTHFSKEPKLRFIATTADRARVIDEFLAAAPRWVHPGDFTIAFDYTPMLHYLTDTRPYLPNPNPMYYSAEIFDDALKAAADSNLPMPVIFDAKGPLNDDWPRDAAEGPVANLKKFNAERAHLNAFKQAHRYRRVWENGYFEIWIPEQPDAT